MRFNEQRRCSVRAGRRIKCTLIVISNFGGENATYRTQHCFIGSFNRAGFVARNHHSIAAGRCVINVLGDYISSISLCFVRDFVTVPSENRLGYTFCILEDIWRSNSGQIYFTKFLFRQHDPRTMLTMPLPTSTHFIVHRSF